VLFGGPDECDGLLIPLDDKLRTGLMWANSAAKSQAASFPGCGLWSCCDDTSNLDLQRSRQDSGDYIVFVGFGNFGFVEAAGL